MPYWIYITNLENWEITKKKKILGAAEKYRKSLSRINKGDKILIYVKGQALRGAAYVQPTIVGEYEATSTVFSDDQKIFHAPETAPNEIFKCRLRLKQIKVPEHSVQFKPLINELDFIKNKQYWSLTLRGLALLNLPEKDYTFISSKL